MVRLQVLCPDRAETGGGRGGEDPLGPVPWTGDSDSSQAPYTHTRPGGGDRRVGTIGRHPCTPFVLGGVWDGRRGGGGREGSEAPPTPGAPNVGSLGPGLGQVTADVEGPQVRVALLVLPGPRRPVPEVAVVAGEAVLDGRRAVLRVRPLVPLRLLGLGGDLALEGETSTQITVEGGGTSGERQMVGGWVGVNTGVRVCVYTCVWTSGCLRVCVYVRLCEYTCGRTHVSVSRCVHESVCGCVRCRTGPIGLRKTQINPSPVSSGYLGRSVGLRLLPSTRWRTTKSGRCLE